MWYEAWYKIIILTHLFLNICTLSVGCFILKKKSPIGIRRFLTHLLFAIVGGGLIQFVLVLFYPVLSSADGKISFHISDIRDYYRYYPFSWHYYSFMSGILAILILGGYNYWLSRKFLNLSEKQSIFIGTIIGIFTNLFLFLFLMRSLIAT